MGLIRTLFNMELSSPRVVLNILEKLNNDLSQEQKKIYFGRNVNLDNIITDCVRKFERGEFKKFATILEKNLTISYMPFRNTFFSTIEYASIEDFDEAFENGIQELRDKSHLRLLLLNCIKYLRAQNDSHLKLVKK